MITLIAAISLNGTIGDANKIPWRLPEDLKHFKETTQDHVVIMGRKTFESLGKKPLPQRENIILTRRLDEEALSWTTLKHQGHFVTIAADIDSALREGRRFPDKEIFIIGGSEIYRQTIDLADRLIISHVQIDCEGDSYFPTIDPETFAIKNVTEYKNTTIPFNVVEYRRI